MRRKLGASAIVLAASVETVGCASAHDVEPPVTGSEADAAPYDAGRRDAGRADGADSGDGGGAGPGEGSDDGGIFDTDASVPDDDGGGSTAGYIRLLAEAQRILSTVKSTTYQHATDINETTHTFNVDCSGFLDYVMSRAVPDAFSQLQGATQTRPVAQSYVSWVSSLGQPVGRWHRVTRAADIVPGDIIAWTKPADVVSTDTGHVMIVAGAPMKAGTNLLTVLVIDSANSGHGMADMRTINKSSGVGEGTVALMTDASGAPNGYHWSDESVSKPETTTVVLAHLD
jgi:hypothetical protein